MTAEQTTEKTTTEETTTEPTIEVTTETLTISLQVVIETATDREQETTTTKVRRIAVDKDLSTKSENPEVAAYIDSLAAGLLSVGPASFRVLYRLSSVPVSPTEITRAGIETDDFLHALDSAKEWADFRAVEAVWIEATTAPIIVSGIPTARNEDGEIPRRTIDHGRVQVAPETLP